MNALAKRGNQSGMIKPWGSFDDLLGDFGFTFNEATRYSPVMEETDKDYVCEFDMPGLDKEDIDITVDSGYMLIKGYKEDGKRVRDYSESIKVGDSVDEGGIKAEYKNGVLVLKIPKAKEHKKIKTIPVI